MLLAYDYPLLGIIVSTMWFFLWILWIMTLFHVIADIFRSHDLGGVAKGAWLIFVLLVPFLGVLAYVLVRGDEMSKHALESVQASDAAAQAYIRQAAGTQNVPAQLSDLAALRDSGELTDTEYEIAKAKILA